MSDRDWDAINIDSITVTDNSEIVFLNCKTQEDANQFTSRAKNIPNDNTKDALRITMHVDQRAMKRFKSLQIIAKSIRENSKTPVQTTIRSGKNDFLIRKREKGSNTPWNEITPIEITQDLPQFEIGTYYDLINPENNVYDIEN